MKWLRLPVVGVWIASVLLTPTVASGESFSGDSGGLAPGTVVDLYSPTFFALLMSDPSARTTMGMVNGIETEIVSLQLQGIHANAIWETRVGQPARILVVAQLSKSGPSQSANGHQVETRFALGREYKVADATVSNSLSDRSWSGVTVDSTRGGAKILWAVNSAALEVGPQYLVLTVETDTNPAGRQEFTSPGFYGTWEASLKVRDQSGKVRASLEDLTGPTITARSAT